MQPLYSARTAGLRQQTQPRAGDYEATIACDCHGLNARVTEIHIEVMKVRKRVTKEIGSCPDRSISKFIPFLRIFKNLGDLV